MITNVVIFAKKIVVAQLLNIPSIRRQKNVYWPTFVSPCMLVTVCTEILIVFEM